jgi:hypothetical protein
MSNVVLNISITIWDSWFLGWHYYNTCG